MQIDFSRVLKTFDGEYLTEDGSPNGRPLTLSAVAIAALVGPSPSQETLSSDEQLRRYKIGVMIQGAEGNAVAMSAEDVALLKKLVAQRYSWPLLVGQALLILEGDAS